MTIRYSLHAMRIVEHLHVIFPACLCVTICLGCGAKKETVVYPASGTIKYADGLPLAGGTIFVHCSPPARGVVNEDGTFALGTYGTDDGAPLGVHPVSILAELPADFDPDGGRRPVGLKSKYARPDTSGITISIQAEGKNYSEIVVERADR